MKFLLMKTSKSKTVKNFCNTAYTRNLDLLRIFRYSVQMWENADQKNSEYEHFSRSERQWRQFTFTKFHNL